MEITRRNPSTHEGYSFNVTVNRAEPFDVPYKPAEMRRKKAAQTVKAYS